LASVLIGKFDSFGLFIGLRFFNGIAMSAVEPALFSLVGDYFPSSIKSTANAIIIAGTFLGTSGSSLLI
jgi:MFS family permease